MTIGGIVFNIAEISSFSSLLSGTPGCSIRFAFCISAVTKSTSTVQYPIIDFRVTVPVSSFDVASSESSAFSVTSAMLG